MSPRSAAFTLALATILAGALTSQTYSVSPAPYATLQGNASNPIPLYNANARYQQIHGDLRGTPRLVQGMALRRGAGSQPTAGPRTVDLTVRLANSLLTQVSATFAANYATPPMTVVPSGPVNFPDWTMSGGNPEPWSLVVPFTTPFVYPGIQDLLWEWLVTNNSSPNLTYAADAYTGITADLVTFPNVTIGTGCLATGQTNPMSFGPRCYSSRVLNALYFRGTALYGVANSPSAILLGASNPSLAIPGLCTSLYTDMLISFPAIATGTLASFSTPDLLVPYDANWQGLKLYSQAVTTDFGQPGLPLALSPGVENVIGAMQPPGVSPVVRIFELTSTTSLAGTVNFYAYGLIVRFTH